jgi:hypothetical protein
MKRNIQIINSTNKPTKSIKVLRELIRDLVITKDLCEKKVYKQNLIKYLKENY